MAKIHSILHWRQLSIHCHRKCGPPISFLLYIFQLATPEPRIRGFLRVGRDFCASELLFATIHVGVFHPRAAWLRCLSSLPTSVRIKKRTAGTDAVNGTRRSPSTIIWHHSIHVRPSLLLLHLPPPDLISWPIIGTEGKREKEIETYSRPLIQLLPFAARAPVNFSDKLVVCPTSTWPSAAIPYLWYYIDTTLRRTIDVSL